jgi:hypothetical protein
MLASVASAISMWELRAARLAPCGLLYGFGFHNVVQVVAIVLDGKGGGALHIGRGWSRQLQAI